MYKRVFGDNPEEKVEENKENGEDEKVKKSMFSRIKDRVSSLRKSEKNAESKVVWDKLIMMILIFSKGCMDNFYI